MFYFLIRSAAKDFRTAENEAEKRNFEKRCDTERIRQKRQAGPLIIQKNIYRKTKESAKGEGLMEINAKSSDRNLLLEFSGELDHHGARNSLREVELAIDAA